METLVDLPRKRGSGVAFPGSEPGLVVQGHGAAIFRCLEPASQVHGLRVLGFLFVTSAVGCFPDGYEVAGASPKRQRQWPPQIEPFLVHPSIFPSAQQTFAESLLWATPQGGS